MSDLKVTPTSRSSADVSDIVLRETGITRLVFRPTLVENPSDPAAAVRGSFVFQRKGPKERWGDTPVERLTSLKKGEGYHLELKSAEVLNLQRELAALYDIHAREGIPSGESEYVQAQGALLSLSNLSSDQLNSFLEANATVGAELIIRLLRWASESEVTSGFVELLESLGSHALGALNAAVSLGTVREALAVWETGEHLEDGEEFWQTFLTERSFLIEQVFSWPCTVVGDKAYVGGKSVENTGGHIVDFLVKNQLTDSAALVEIKKPSSDLVGGSYRTDIPQIAPDLIGSVVQVLSYKASLSETYLSLGHSVSEFEVFDPPCVVIIGCVGSLTSPEEKRSFELFRRQLKEVEVISFDELFGKLQTLVDILASRTARPST